MKTPSRADGKALLGRTGSFAARRQMVYLDKPLPKSVASNIPVAVSELSESADAARIEAGAAAIWNAQAPNHLRWRHQLPNGKRDECIAYARALLSSLNLVSPRKKKAL